MLVLAVSNKRINNTIGLSTSFCRFVSDGPMTVFTRIRWVKCSHVLKIQDHQTVQNKSKGSISAAKDNNNKSKNSERING